jgi:hypothetical protein
MKKTYTLLLFLLATVSILAQAPEKMSYQAVLRDASNTLLTNQEVGMQISILQTTITGVAVYIETKTATTNINGLVSIAIGSGTSSDDFSAIDWSAGPYFIKTATDPSGGSSYSITGTSQIMSVPFAMYAKTSGSSETNATNISKNTSDIATNVIAITANTLKVGYTEALVSANTDVAANTAKVGTNAANVTAAGALMDSELTDLAGIKAVTIATLQEKPAEGAFADGDKTKLDAIEASADVTDAANVAAAGALMDSELTDLAGIKAVTISTLQVIPSEGAFVDGDKTKLDGIEALIEALEYKVSFLEAQVPNAEVGDFRAGGVVFWLDPADNRHGLVCAIEDQSAGIQWYNGSFITTGATGTAIGAGRANTAAIIASQGTPETSYAAGLARVYGGGGYTDWFLPSKDALNQMFLNRAAINATATVNGGSSFTSNYYWSSTEFVSNLAAWGYNLNDQFQWYYFKDNTYGVRAVRAF